MSHNPISWLCDPNVPADAKLLAASLALGSSIQCFAFASNIALMTFSNDRFEDGSYCPADSFYALALFFKFLGAAVGLITAVLSVSFGICTGEDPPLSLAYSTGLLPCFIGDLATSVAATMWLSHGAMTCGYTHTGSLFALLTNVFALSSYTPLGLLCAGRAVKLCVEKLLHSHSSEDEDTPILPTTSSNVRYLVYSGA